jgi:hypothetical protein
MWRSALCYSGRILVEKNTDKTGFERFLSFFLVHSTLSVCEVKGMELVNKRTNTAVRSWSNRAGRKSPAVEDYSSELRSWVQRAILDAEETKDFGKKDRFLSLLKDL